MTENAGRYDDTRGEQREQRYPVGQGIAQLFDHMQEADDAIAVGSGRGVLGHVQTHDAALFRILDRCRH